MKLLLLGKHRDDFYFEKAIDFLQINFSDLEIRLAKPGETFPASLYSWQGDYILSYLCPWVLPDKFLKAAKKAAINFHPGPPEYPGTGCTNFALYHEVKEYGVTCHHMAPRVDSGRIVAVSRFPVFDTDSVYSLTQRCYAYMLVLFFEIMNKIIMGNPLPESDEQWTRKPFTRKDLEELKRINKNMSDEEISRRIRASAYPGFQGAFIEIAGEIFEHKPVN